MKIDLTGQRAVVSGSTGGIGFAIAQGLAAAGASVVLNGRTAPAVDEAVAALQKAVPGAQVRGVPCDLGTAEGCNTLLQAEPDADILVNNVGIYGPRDFFDIDDALWTKFFDVNVMSAVRLSRGLAEGMARRKKGRIVFISSESGLNIPADMIHYGFTKTALLSLSRGLAKRLAGTGVTVNAVLPGPTMSDGVETMLRAGAEKTGKTVEEVGTAFVKRQRASSIIQRMATVEEVANMVVYVCSPQASATTGAALRVDGGVVDTIA